MRWIPPDISHKQKCFGNQPKHLSILLCGRRGIRTPGTLIEYVSLANWWFQPLTHPSWPNNFWSISPKEWCKCRQKKLLCKISVGNFSLFSIIVPFSPLPKDWLRDFDGESWALDNVKLWKCMGPNCADGVILCIKCPSLRNYQYLCIMCGHCGSRWCTSIGVACECRIGRMDKEISNNLKL